MSLDAIDIKGLRKDYRGFSLSNVSLTLPKGHIMGFVGQNGAGKTTTIRLLLNMTKRNNGSIQILGLDNVLEEQKIKQSIGVVFDDTFFAENWKVSEVEKAIRNFYTNWNSTSYSQYLKDFNLPTDKKVKELSRGMKMKLMLAVAMCHNAELLILDEPTSGIDPVARDELLEILSAYVADGEKSIFFSTHITTDLEKIADYITLIYKGNIFYTGTKEDLMRSYNSVKGNLTELTDDLRKRIIGLSVYRTEFEGLIPAAEAKSLSSTIAMGAPTIDEILVAVSKQK